MFMGEIGDDTIKWYRMEYKDAEHFYAIVQNNPSDN
jgi:hypothetical protein